MTFKLMLIIFLICLAFATFGQQGNSRIDKKDLKKFIRILTSDTLEGRETGSAGQKKAEQFIAERFKELGLNTFNQNGYLEKFKLTQVYWGQVYIKTQNNTLENFENMVFQGSNTQNSEVEKEIVFGGRGTKAELSQINVKDRLVLVFVPNLRSYHDINRDLEKRGAFGLIVANPQNDKQFESIKNTFKDYSLQKRQFFPDASFVKNEFSRFPDSLKFINTVVIPNSQIKNISGISPSQLEKLIAEGNIKAPISKAKVKFERVKEEIETANVIGTIKGSTDKTIIVSAHYDHLGKVGKEYFPGADDNASGTAALLELAEEYSNLKNLEYSIMFIATSGEEAGLLGSFYHVNTPTFIPANILCDLNIDMISRHDNTHHNNNYLYCVGIDQSKEMSDMLKKADGLYDKCSFDYSLKEPAGIFTRSDNYNFYKKGIISIEFFSGLHSDYHKPTDTIEKIDFSILENRVHLISTVIQLLQKEGLKINGN